MRGGRPPDSSRAIADWVVPQTLASGSREAQLAATVGDLLGDLGEEPAVLRAGEALAQAVDRPLRRMSPLFLAQLRHRTRAMYSTPAIKVRGSGRAPQDRVAAGPLHDEDPHAVRARPVGALGGDRGDERVAVVLEAPRDGDDAAVDHHGDVLPGGRSVDAPVDAHRGERRRRVVVALAVALNRRAPADRPGEPVERPSEQSLGAGRFRKSPGLSSPSPNRSIWWARTWARRSRSPSSSPTTTSPDEVPDAYLRAVATPGEQRAAVGLPRNVDAEDVGDRRDDVGRPRVLVDDLALGLAGRLHEERHEGDFLHVSLLDAPALAVLPELTPWSATTTTSDSS